MKRAYDNIYVYFKNLNIKNAHSYMSLLLLIFVLIVRLYCSHTLITKQLMYTFMTNVTQK